MDTLKPFGPAAVFWWCVGCMRTQRWVPFEPCHLLIGSTGGLHP